MKKNYAIILLVIVGTMGIVSISYADNGPHGGYSAMTDKCAVCHRAHTAKGENLLAGEATATDKSGFCYSCHSGGAGAYTDVRDGLQLTGSSAPLIYESTYLTDTDVPLMAGGFENVRMNVAFTGTLNLPVTSRHMVQGGSNTVWGYDILGSNNAGLPGVSLTCTDCHNPHGRAGANNTATYRILKGNNSSNLPLFTTGTVTVLPFVDVPDEPDDRWYYIENSIGSYYFPDTPEWPSDEWPSPGFSNSYFPQHTSNVGGVNIYARLTSWCSQCHTRYRTGTMVGPGHTDSGDSVYTFRHRTSGEGGSGCGDCHISMHAPRPVTYPGCITCHVAHGTGARTGPYSSEVAWPDGTSTPNNHERSALLRLDGRGVCMQCHPWGTGRGGY